MLGAGIILTIAVILLIRSIRPVLSAGAVGVEQGGTHRHLYGCMGHTHACLPHRMAQKLSLYSFSPRRIPFIPKGYNSEKMAEEKITFCELLTHPVSLCWCASFFFLAVLGLLILGSGWPMMSLSYHIHLAIRILSNTGKFTMNFLPGFLQISSTDKVVFLPDTDTPPLISMQLHRVL